MAGVTLRESPGNASKGSGVGVHSSLESNFFLTNVCLFGKKGIKCVSECVCSCARECEC